jgi:hypothetical protein
MHLERPAAMQVPIGTVADRGNRQRQGAQGRPNSGVASRPAISPKETRPLTGLSRRFSTQHLNGARGAGGISAISGMLGKARLAATEVHWNGANSRILRLT